MFLSFLPLFPVGGIKVALLRAEPGGIAADRVANFERHLSFPLSDYYRCLLVCVGLFKGIIYYYRISGQRLSIIRLLLLLLLRGEIVL